ncbi:class I SAM-dependent DNA methyltransferase [Enterovirga aerilata]|uniref:Methyltransferase domain-containing protein n=1 Tax=Enterovirga aerilata TaxID=2730920 RepID=A0A849I0J9_9HYPH|nr:methyltransferase domain-containing protein [Enterovirga sp. DB1703]NNM70921.1 methyltransferase domain-containing protein [Enterovirga sp. DB1703]
MQSSGDLLADRRYAYAKSAFDEEDWEAAADLARQALELAPGFAPAWFLLGEACQKLAERDETSRDEAVAAFSAARRFDPDDGLGAGVRLALLGAEEPRRAMSAAYVRSLFDEYAIRFDRHLRQSLAYRGPELLHDAVRRASSRILRPFRFDLMLDLGCGTGLAAEVFRPQCRRIAGVDLSPAMARKAEAKGIYDEVEIGELLPWLEAWPEGAADLVLAADVFVYLADLAPVFAAAARALDREGLFAFTVQHHGGDGIILGEDQRYAHGEAHLRSLAAASSLDPVILERVSTRQDRGQDVPGLLLVLAR